MLITYYFISEVDRQSLQIACSFAKLDYYK